MIEIQLDRKKCVVPHHFSALVLTFFSMQISAAAAGVAGGRESITKSFRSAFFPRLSPFCCLMYPSTGDKLAETEKEKVRGNCVALLASLNANVCSVALINRHNGNLLPWPLHWNSSFVSSSPSFLLFWVFLLRVLLDFFVFFLFFFSLWTVLLLFCTFFFSTLFPCSKMFLFSVAQRNVVQNFLSRYGHYRPMITAVAASLWHNSSTQCVISVGGGGGRSRRTSVWSPRRESVNESKKHTFTFGVLHRHSIAHWTAFPSAFAFCFSFFTWPDRRCRWSVS